MRSALILNLHQNNQYKKMMSGLFNSFNDSPHTLNDKNNFPILMEMIFNYEIRKESLKNLNLTLDKVKLQNAKKLYHEKLKENTILPLV